MARNQRGSRKDGGVTQRTLVRAGGNRLTITNSGLEVWLYDDANREAIRSAQGADPGFGGMPPAFPEQTKQGRIVGYSLCQDDDVDVEVIVGRPLTGKELATARWLEPQRALLRLPSGRLCIESNDASRVGPEKPGAKGARTDVPAGAYRLTLYRVDHEALDREGIEWDGAQEVIVLTPGGTARDAADYLLPFEERRDLAWVGKYRVDGKRATCLVWFGDSWDTFTLNLDAGAASRLSLVPGSYFRTTIPDAGIALISAFATSWDDARKLQPPAGLDLDEYGYAAFQPMADWDGAIALFCRRDTSKTGVKEKHQTMWIPAVVEVLDVRPTPAVAGGARDFTPINLATRSYFDPGFLSLVLSDLLPEVVEREEIDLAQVLSIVDRKLDRMDLVPAGDYAWTEQKGPRWFDSDCRLYTGRSDSFAAALVREGSFELLLLSELTDGSWIATGLADEIDRAIMKKDDMGIPLQHPRIRLENMDESLSKIASVHKSALKDASVKGAPVKKADALAAFARFLAVAAE